MALPAIAWGIMAAGTALQFWGSSNAAKAQARASKRDAEIAELQAQEVLGRAKLNTVAMLREEGRLIGTQVSQFAKGHIDVSSGGAMDVMSDTISESRRQIYNMQREADFRAQVLRAGGKASVDLANETRQAGMLSAWGGVFTNGLNGAMQAGMFDKNDGKTTGAKA